MCKFSEKCRRCFERMCVYITCHYRLWVNAISNVINVLPFLNNLRSYFIIFLRKKSFIWIDGIGRSADKSIHVFLLSIIVATTTTRTPPTTKWTTFISVHADNLSPQYTCFTLCAQDNFQATTVLYHFPLLLFPFHLSYRSTLLFKLCLGCACACVWLFLGSSSRIASIGILTVCWCVAMCDTQMTLLCALRSVSRSKLVHSIHRWNEWMCLLFTRLTHQRYFFR